MEHDENCLSVPRKEYRRLICEGLNTDYVRSFLRRMRERGCGVSHDEILILCDLLCEPAERGEREC